MKKIITFILTAAVFFQGCFFQSVYADDFAIDEVEPFVGTISADESGKQKLPVLDAASAIVMDTVTGRVLFEKNAYTKRPMASTTKIMTAIVAIETGKLQDVVTVSKRAAAVGGSTIHLKQGEKLTLEEMLYGLMLKSGNDAAIAIAEHIGGTVDAFLEMMNEKARLLGARSTSFKSPHGLDNPSHFSTAYDMAVITKYAMQNPVFSRIVGTRSINLVSRDLSNTNEMLSLYPGADGVKTGYTGLAGRCLVTSATRDKWRLISVVLGCSTRQKRAQSSKSILDYSFGNYVFYDLVKAGAAMGKIRVYKGKPSDVETRAAEGITLPLRKDELERLEKRVILAEQLDAPVIAGESLGTVEFLLNGEIIAQSPLKAWQDSERKGFFDYFAEIAQAWLKIAKTGLREIAGFSRYP